MLQGFIVDVDGTLIDDTAQHIEAWHAAFAGAGLEQARAVIRKQMGKGGDRLVPYLLLDEGLTETDRQRLSRRIDKSHAEIFRERYLYRVKPLPGAVGLLRRMADLGLKIALASSGRPEEIDHFIKLLGVGEILSAVITSGDAESTKPAPDVFVKAVEALQLPPEKLAAVGDTPYDIAAARAAGMPCVGLLTGAFRANELGGAVAVYGDAVEMTAHLEELLQRLG